MLLKATGKEEFYTLVSTDLTAGESVSGLCHIKCHEGTCHCLLATFAPEATPG